MRYHDVKALNMRLEQIHLLHLGIQFNQPDCDLTSRLPCGTLTHFDLLSSWHLLDFRFSLHSMYPALTSLLIHETHGEPAPCKLRSSSFVVFYQSPFDVASMSCVQMPCSTPHYIHNPLNHRFCLHSVKIGWLKWYSKPKGQHGDTSWPGTRQTGRWNAQNAGGIS